MNIEFRGDFGGVERRLRDVAAGVTSAATAGVQQGGAWLLQLSQNELQRLVYDRPIPRLRTKRGLGKPAWTRTGQLKAGERVRYESLPDGARAIIENSAPYAIARATLNRKSPTDGQTRRANWRESARAAGANRAADLVRQRVNASLRAL